MIFNEAQIACLEAKENKIIVNASAGTGKTTVLVEAARRAIENKEKVVLITLTRDAAVQMEEKLSYRADFTGTIHGFALREIHKMSEKHIFKNKIMTSEEVKEALVQALMKIDGSIKRGYKEEITKLLRYMNSGYYDDKKELQRFFKILKEYDNVKRRYNLYDFNDTPEYLLELMKRFNWKLDYDAFYVDEVQDIDKYEFELIKKVEGRVFLIGDPKQSIYLFRNSVENIFDKFEDLGYYIYILIENYRSYQEILDFAEADLEAIRGCGGVITDERLLLEDINTKILCRTNMEVEILSQYYPNVSTIHAFKGLEADDVVVVEFATSSIESINVKFVALTRARNRLGVTSLQSLLKLKGELNGKV